MECFHFTLLHTFAHNFINIRPLCSSYFEPNAKQKLRCIPHINNNCIKIFLLYLTFNKIDETIDLMTTFNILSGERNILISL